MRAIGHVFVVSWHPAQLCRGRGRRSPTRLDGTSSFCSFVRARPPLSSRIHRFHPSSSSAISFFGSLSKRICTASFVHHLAFLLRWTTSSWSCRPFDVLSTTDEPGWTGFRIGLEREERPMGPASQPRNTTVERPTLVRIAQHVRGDGRREATRSDLHERRDRTQDSQVRGRSDGARQETARDRWKGALTRGRTQERSQQRQSGTCPGRLHRRSPSGRRMRENGGKSALLYGHQVSDQCQSPSQSAGPICGTRKNHGEWNGACMKGNRWKPELTF